MKQTVCDFDNEKDIVLIWSFWLISKEEWEEGFNSVLISPNGVVISETDSQTRGKHENRFCTSEWKKKKMQVPYTKIFFKNPDSLWGWEWANLYPGPV